jgi:hypothetical protein
LPLDFNRIQRPTTADTATEPRRIFSTLPSKDPRYAYARDVQSEVWEAWHARRSESDLVIKMNTGGGKTVVGLVLLKSCLNEGAGPAVYVTPDIYLSEQVAEEAHRLGIETCAEPSDPRFLSGRAILVVNIYRLFNGLSVFGVRGGTRAPIDVGTFLIDDAHACLATVDAQFTLRIPSHHPSYLQLIDLFVEDLRQQSQARLSELGSGDAAALMTVPYWAWQRRIGEVIALLEPHRQDDELVFAWPLIRDCLSLCRVAISSDGIEIAPPCLPVDQVPSFAAANRRIYLTATLADDSVLLTHFGADAESISAPVTPRTADDLGDRMILIPQATFPGTTDEDVRDFVVDQSRFRNVVVIVPSRRRADFWRGVAAEVLDRNTIAAGLERLRVGHVGLVVLINKYDGIDLPGDACHVLVLDGLPEAQGEMERLEALELGSSNASLRHQIQRIEQGMGRGVRSNDDFCVVLLLGARLTARLFPSSSRAMFSPATRKQLELSDEVAEQLRQQPFEELAAAVEQCLSRDPGWVAASRDAVDGITYPDRVEISDAAAAERAAFDFAQRGRYSDASDGLSEAARDTQDAAQRGWLLQQSALYMQHVDGVAAERLQRTAVDHNRSLIKPRAGVPYVRLNRLAEQGIAASEHLSNRYRSAAELTIGMEAVLDDLVPDPDPVRVSAFEQAMKDLALCLGLNAQRPEQEFGNGPDVLWMLGELNYLVIECKSGASADAISRSDIEQLAQSVDWFESAYDPTCTATPVLVHPASRLDRQATARPETRVITFDRLADFRDAVRRLSVAVARNSAYRDPGRTAERLAAEGLNAPQLAERWGVRARAAGGGRRPA